MDHDDGHGPDGRRGRGPADRKPGGALRLEAVGRRYGVRGHWVLRGVDLTVPPGSLVRVTGANGSGKSTLLRIVAGADRPGAGRVTGRPADATAFVPERFPPALPFPVLRYLTHLGAVRGLSAGAARARALHWLERFGITGYAATPLDELSKGTCQKVAVAQALLTDPRLLVLDEAWTGLDAPARAALDDAVRERVAAGATVFFVDHDARRLAEETTARYSVDTGRYESLPPAARTRPGAGPEVVIEAAGGGEVPPRLREFAGSVTNGTLRAAVPAARSDAALRDLLAARPPWHITAVRTRTARNTAPAPVPALPAGGRRPAAALLRYRADGLLRSHRWLPPFLCYGAVMAIGVAGGQPMLGSLGYAAALLLPVAAWLVRATVSAEPGAARACVASAVGAVRARRAPLVVALALSVLLGAAGTGVVAAVCAPHSDDLRATVAPGAAALAGLMAAAVSALLGTAVGALTTLPRRVGRGWSLLTTGLLAGAVLLVSGSPAQAAVSGLVEGSRTGAVAYPVLPLALAAAAAGLVLWAAPRFSAS